MSSILNVSCSSNTCNFIDPINTLNIYPDSNGISKITGRPITGDELNIVYNSYNSICNSKGGEIKTCCDSTITSIDDNDTITQQAFTDFKKTFPSGRFLTSSNGTSTLQLSTRNMNSVYGWDATTPYMMCKAGSPNIQVSADRGNRGKSGVFSISGLNTDCISNKCSGDSVSFDMLMSNIKQDSNYTFYDDSKVADDIKNGSVDNVKAYIYKYNYVDQPMTGDDLQNRMIHIACFYNQLDILQLLIAVNANINMKNLNGDTPLHITVSNNNKDTTNLLISQGASITERNNAGETAMFSAVKTGDITMVLTLYNNTAGVLDKDSKGNNLCHYTIKYAPNNKRDLINFFIGHGVSVDEKNADGQTALDLLNSLINEEVEQSSKSNKLPKSVYMAIKNDLFNNRMERNTTMEMNNAYVVEEFANNTISIIRENSISDKLADLLSVQTTLRNQMYKATNGSSTVSYNSGNIGSIVGSPIAYDNKICVPRYGATMEEASEIIGNETPAQCKALGGEIVENTDPTTNITVGFYSSLDQDIAKIKSEDVYNRVYSELIDAEAMPAPNLSIPTQAPVFSVSVGAESGMMPAKMTMTPSPSPTSSYFMDKLNDIESMISSYSNLMTYLVIVILVLSVLWGGYYIYNQYFANKS